MAIMDNEVETTMDAFRSNPNALMQRFQKGQQLIDLLALQKLKSEKEAAARQMKMQMQQNPSTIKEQREKEVLDMTKNELIQQTSGLMALNNARRQNNLKKVASAGISGRPAPNMRTMANGGIVGYASAGEISSKIANLRQQLIDGDITPAEYREQAQEIRFGADGGPRGPIALDAAKKSDDLFFQTITKQESPKDVKSVLKNVTYGQQPPNTIPAGIENILKSDAGMTKTDVGPPAGPVTDPLDRIDRSNLTMIDDGTLKDAFEDREPAPDTGIAKLTKEDILGKDGLGGLNFNTVNYKPIAGDIANRVDELKKSYGPIIDKEAVGLRAQANFMDSMKGIIPERERIQREKASGIEKLIGEKEDFYANIQDPDKLRNRQLRAALAGAAGQATFGTTGAGITRASLAEEKAQEDFKVKGFQDIFGDKKDLTKMIGNDKVSTLDKSAEIIKAGFDIGMKKEQNQAIENAAKMKVLAGFDRDALAAISDDNKNFLKADIANKSMAQKANIAHMNTMIKIADINMRGDIANLQATISREKNSILEEANRLKDATNKTQIASTLFGKIESIKAKMVENLTKTYQKKIAEAGLGKSREEQKKIEQEMLTQMNAIIDGNTAHLDSMTKFVMKQLQALGGGGGGTSPGFKSGSLKVT